MEAAIRKLEVTVFSRVEYILELGGIKKDIVFLVLSGLAVLASLFDIQPFPFDIAWVAIILCGVPIILEAIIGLVTEFDIKADVLVSLALIAAIVTGEIFAAAEVAFIMQIGALLEDITVAKARAGIEKLVNLTPQEARLMTSSGETLVDAELVQVGDILRVLPGETIPVDGEIISGETSINQAVLTGESLPVDKTVGDTVASGTVNQFGAFHMRATKVGEDSSIQRMIRLVQSADAGKAKIVGLADRWATWVVLIALLSAVGTWWVTGEILRAVTILVVFCPCALVLATPTAIMAAIGNATKHGFLVREGDALERLATVTKVTFDKTGTLTYGTPTVVAIETVGNTVATTKALGEYKINTVYGANGVSGTNTTYETNTAYETNATYGTNVTQESTSTYGTNTAQAIFQLTASLEAMSEHPLGKAIVKAYKEKQAATLKVDASAVDSRKAESAYLLPCSDFKMLPGRGVSGIIGGQLILAGNDRLMAEQGIAISPGVAKTAQLYLDKGSTIVYIAIANTLVGYLVLADTVRPDSAQMVDRLHRLGVQTVLLTGDNQNAAYAIGSQLGIREIVANCLPEDKLNYINQRQQVKQNVAMIGDGINDAPALKKSNVGIAMGGIGSDIAVDAADIALVDDEVKELPHLIALAKRMMSTIKWNLAFAMILNFVAIGLSFPGILNPVTGALVHNAGSVLVIINSALLLKWRSA
ncbi:heavy metal translocating P-type ATPase [Veillonella intestinalis]|uniref:heavy metal translocating P-type ATPase n=1 Tax=Veillonella intestinalis TaxID=2941341 RepID=UPI00204208F2|nr:cation-translocating P-type ATPase [Veillonella intestinalis]